MSWRFVVDGDIHGQDDNGNLHLGKLKEYTTSRIIRYSSKKPVEFVLCCGDLTQHGDSGFPAIGTRKRRELQAWKNLYEIPLETAGIEVLATVGNHDLTPESLRCYTGVSWYIAEKHGATKPIGSCTQWIAGCWYFKKRGIHFLCCGVHPLCNPSWVKNKLKEIPTSEPVFIWFHYNINIDELWADFWTVEEKEKFWQMIKNHNVIGIATGHNHSTLINLWHDIPIIRGSGSNIAVVEISKEKIKNVLGVYRSGREYDMVSQWNKTKKSKKYNTLNHNTREKFLPE